MLYITGLRYDVNCLDLKMAYTAHGLMARNPVNIALLVTSRRHSIIF